MNFNLLLSNESKLNKFRSDMGARQQIARNNGASYELHSNVPIPEVLNNGLIKKEFHILNINIRRA